MERPDIQRASETPLVQEFLLGWRMMGSRLVSAPFMVLANAPLDIKKKLNQSVAPLCLGSHCRVWGEIWLPLGRNTREIHREKFHSNRLTPGWQSLSSCPLLIMHTQAYPGKGLSLPQLVFALNAGLKNMTYSP